jgi:glycosyltransferase involved in cell wall biosynthesis
MSHAKPVIGGAHGGTPDVIDEGVTGFLVPYGDIEQLCGRLRLLLTDGAARHAMGQQALERVCRDFTFDCFQRNLEGAIAPLLAASGHSIAAIQRR